MSLHRIELVIEVDDEELAEHVKVAEKRGGPYTARGEEWNASDVFAMADRGIVDPDGSEFTYRGKVAVHGSTD